MNEMEIGRAVTKSGFDAVGIGKNPFIMTVKAELEFV